MASKARILLVGSGGIGTITALNLEAGGLATVSCVLRSNYKNVTENGFKIDAIDHGQIASWRPTEILKTVPDVAAEGLQPFDYVICTTKNVPDVSPTIEEIIKPAVTPGHSVILLIQNGINIEKPMLKAFPNNICLSGVSRMGANEPTPGFIVENDRDILYTSIWHNPNIDATKEKAAIDDFIRLYSASGKAECTHDEDVLFIRWRKLMYNAVYNPICALVDMDTTRLRLASPDSDPANPLTLLVRPAMNEIRAAALAAANVTLPEDLVDFQVEVDDMDIWCEPSMQQDAKKHRFMEYENILGEALREGEKAGVPMPTIKVLYALCKAKQWQTMEYQGMVDAKALMLKRKAAMTKS